MTVAVLAACGSSTSSTAPGVAAYDRSATTANTTAMAAAPITTPELAAKLKAGSSKVTSAHVTMSIKVGNKSVLSAEGDETLANGKLSAMRLSEKVGTLNLTIMIVDGNVYVKLPPSLNKSGKPWEKATMGSTNPVLKQLASSISSSQQSASLSQYGSFAQAAVSVRTVGIEQVNGTTSTHESLIVDVTKIHSEAITEAMKTALAEAGVTKIPVDIWMDEQGRPQKLTERITVKGQVMFFDFRLSRLNEPVTIAAPPASQVSTT